MGKWPGVCWVELLKWGPRTHGTRHAHEQIHQLAEKSQAQLGPPPPGVLSFSGRIF